MSAASSSSFREGRTECEDARTSESLKSKSRNASSKQHRGANFDSEPCKQSKQGQPNKSPEDTRPAARGKPERVSRKVQQPNSSDTAAKQGPLSRAAGKQDAAMEGTRFKDKVDSADAPKKDRNIFTVLVKEAGNEKVITVKIPRNSKVDDLKKIISQSSAEYMCGVRIIYGGKFLENGSLLESYGICGDCSVHVILPSSPDGSSSAPSATEMDSIRSTSLTRSSSEQSLSSKTSAAVRRCSSMQPHARSESEEKATIPCEALRYADMKWYRGERGVKTAKGCLVTFTQFRGDGPQDTAIEDLKMRPFWWRCLKEEDIISLEPLSRLKYEPFELPSSPEKTHWFDGKVLANYLISSANFLHPVSRRPLERTEMMLLDEYLRKYSLCKAMVVHVYDRKDDSSENALNHVTALRREAADLLGALFATRNAAPSARGPLRRDAPSLRSQHLSGMAMLRPAQDSELSRRANRRERNANSSAGDRARAESLRTTLARLRAAAESEVQDGEVSTRNQALISKMKMCLLNAEQRRQGGANAEVETREAIESSHLFNELRIVSGDFRSGNLNGGEYAARLFGFFGYKEAPTRDREVIDDVLVELLALLPDSGRRQELSVALVEWVERLGLEEQHLLQPAEAASTAATAARRDRVEQARGGRHGSGTLGIGRETPPAGAGAACADDTVLEPQSFPSLAGADRASVGVFGGAWLSRPRRTDSEPGDAGAGAAASGSGTAQDEAEAFPALLESVVAPGPQGGWGGGEASRTGPVEPTEPAAQRTRKTKRGTLLLF